METQVINEEGVFHLSGPLNAKTAPALFDRDLDIKSVKQLDLQNITHVDSAGLALLIHWRNLANRHASVLEYRNVPPKLMDLATLCAVESVFLTE